MAFQKSKGRQTTSSLNIQTQRQVMIDLCLSPSILSLSQKTYQQLKRIIISNKRIINVKVCPHKADNQTQLNSNMLNTYLIKQQNHCLYKLQGFISESCLLKYNQDSQIQKLMMELKLQCTSRKVINYKQNGQITSNIKNTENLNNTIQIKLFTEQQTNEVLLSLADIQSLFRQQIIDKRTNCIIVLLNRSFQKQKIYQKIYRSYKNKYKLQEQNEETIVKDKTKYQRKRQQVQMPLLIAQNVSELSEILQFTNFKDYQRQCKLQHIMFKTEFATSKQETQYKIKQLALNYIQIMTKKNLYSVKKYIIYYVQNKSKTLKKFINIWIIFTEGEKINRMNKYIQENHLFQTSYFKSLKKKCFYSWKLHVKQQKKAICHYSNYF